MKKILAIAILLGFLTSCGPHRMKCGPGRCMNEMPNKNSVLNKNVA